MTSSSIPLSQDRHHGVGENVRSLISAAVRYAEARLRLFWLESADVLHRVAILLVLALAAVAGVLVTYVGLMIALVLWIARTWWDGDALPAVITLALAHLLLAAACAGWIIFKTRKADVFHATLSEFEEDRRWLNENQTFRN